MWFGVAAPARGSRGLVGHHTKKTIFRPNPHVLAWHGGALSQEIADAIRRIRRYQQHRYDCAAPVVLSLSERRQDFVLLRIHDMIHAALHQPTPQAFFERSSDQMFEFNALLNDLQGRPTPPTMEIEQLLVLLERVDSGPKKYALLHAARIARSAETYVQSWIDQPPVDPAQELAVVRRFNAAVVVLHWHLACLAEAIGDPGVAPGIRNALFQAIVEASLQIKLSASKGAVLRSSRLLPADTSSDSGNTPSGPGPRGTESAIPTDEPAPPDEPVTLIDESATLIDELPADEDALETICDDYVAPPPEDEVATICDEAQLPVADEDESEDDAATICDEVQLPIPPEPEDEDEDDAATVCDEPTPELEEDDDTLVTFAGLFGVASSTSDAA